MPFPPLGERFDRLAEQLEIITGLWYRIRGREPVQLRRQALPRRGNHSPPPRPRIRADHHRWHRTEAHAHHRGPVRRRVQRRPQRRPARDLRAVRPGLRGIGRDPTHGPPLGRAAGGLRDHPGRGDPASRVIGSELIRRHAAIGSPALVADRIEEQRRPARTRSTSTSTTSRTWTTSRCSARRSCAKWGSPKQPASTERHRHREGRTAPRRGTMRAAITRAYHIGRSPSCASTHRATTRSG